LRTSIDIAAALPETECFSFGDDGDTMGQDEERGLLGDQ
jgi:hypothetical protein